MSITRLERGPRVAGFVNAVLRKVARARPESPSPPLRILVPRWLSESLTRGLGAERAARFLDTRPLPPPLGLRVNLEQTGVTEFIDRLSLSQPEARIRAGLLSPRCVLAQGAGDPRALPGYAEGQFAVQEQGSQIIALALGAEDGDQVADACAGHGGKTTVLAQQVGDRGCVTAIDLHEPKLDRLDEELSRLRIPGGRVRKVAVDLTVGTGSLEARFDRVLVDAPCTGLGTIHRRPELLLRLGPKDPARMAELQGAILRTSLRLVKPGGILLYAVCSPTREEGLGVLTSILRSHPGLRIEPMDAVESVGVDDDGLLRLGPWLGESDAYQAFRLKVPA